LKAIVTSNRLKAENAKQKRGKKSPLTVAIEEMDRRIPKCTYKDLLTEMAADACGKECLLFDLREQGVVSIKFTDVTAERITYDTLNGARGKTLRTSSLSNKLSEARKAN